PALRKLLEDESPRVRVNAAQAVWRATNQADGLVSVLTPALKGEEVSVRGGAAVTLGMLGAAAADAVPALIERFTDSDGDVRVFAAEALGKVGAPAVPALTKALRSEEDPARQWAADALGEMHAAAKDAVPALVEVLKDKKDEVRTEAASALGGIGTGA